MKSNKKLPRASQPEASKKARTPAKAGAGADRSQERKAQQAVRRKPTQYEIDHQHSMARFESGLQLFNQNQFSKAKALFEKLTDNPVRELAERARVYVNICEQRLMRAAPQLKTAEELYNYAVGLANEGNPEAAEEHLRKALKLSPQSDYIYYALATTYAQRDNIDGALENLLKAIELNERNRYQAQNDADFANLLEDPRFTELLYPEKPI
jgi:tetratricopeptide (TPR) repeat protein